MTLIKSVAGIRRPNLTEDNMGDLDISLPKNFAPDEIKYEIRHEKELSEEYVPGDLAFKPGFKLKFDKEDGIVLLRGPSGSGKTTFLRTLANSIRRQDDDDLGSYCSHTGFNNGYDEGFVVKYAGILEDGGFPFHLDRRNLDQLDNALSRVPFLRSDRKSVV